MVLQLSPPRRIFAYCSSVALCRTTRRTGYPGYISTRQWRLDEERLPLLLMVVPDPGQEQRVQRLAATILQDLPLQVLTTTATRLEREGPLAPIWGPASPTITDNAEGSTQQRWWNWS